MPDPVLKVEELSCGFNTEDGYIRVVERLSFDIDAGKTLGLVGESGCGKTVTALAIMGLLPRPSGHIEGGTVFFRGNDLSNTSTPSLKEVRGKGISMIFQEPMTALNPVHSIGKQLVEAIHLYEPEIHRTDQRTRALELLTKVGIPEPAQRLKEYPHQLSGGMRQRVLISIAIAGNPDLLVADEPTTALDVTVQAQILELLRNLQTNHGMAMMLITHDLGVVAEICDEVLVMYAGRAAERANVTQLFEIPRHPYSQGLMASIPKLSAPCKVPLPVIDGIVPALDNLPSGCPFSNRCRYSDNKCEKENPPLMDAEPGHQVACHHWQSLSK